MQVTPRKAEVAEIVKLLEDDSYESAEALAKDVIKRTAELFAQRDWFAWVHKDNREEWAIQLAWGPFASQAQAKKLALKAGLGGLNMFLPLGSTASMSERVSRKPPAPWCLNCQHPHHSHEHPRFNGKCAAPGCICPKDVKDTGS